MLVDLTSAYDMNYDNLNAYLIKLSPLTSHRPTNI